MPNWKIHLEVGKRINKKLKYNGEDFNLFLLGNILPDINNCYIVEDISKNLRHSYTHYEYKDEPTYINFYNEYKNLIKDNPIIMGYYVHLYTDYYWTKDFHIKCKNKSVEFDNHDEMRILKQNDFKSYNNKFLDNVIIINDYEKAIKLINKIERVSLNINDIKKVIDYLDVKYKLPEILKFYKEEELDNLMNETIDKLEELL